MIAPAAVSETYPGAALTAWGAGLIQIALGAGTVTRMHGSAVLTPAAGTVLIGLGAAGLAWGGTALARGRLIVPRAGVAGVVAGLIALAAALVSDPTRISLIAVGAASALLLVTGVWCALASRVAGRVMDASRPRVAVVLVSAVVVAGIVTPALATTAAVQLGGRPVVVVEHQH